MTNFFTFQWISLYAFLIVLLIAVLLNRKRIEIQKIAFPILYAGLYKTRFGLKFIDNQAEKHRGWIQFLGYCGIGIGFAGMAFIVIGVVQSLAVAITTPEAPVGVSLVLPQTNIPGLGFLPFWYWIIALFVIVLIHEFAHGIVAKAHDVPVHKSGLGFFAVGVPVIPIAFVEPDEKILAKQGDHVQYSVFAAGPFSNILLAGIIFLMFLLVFFPADKAMTTPDGFSFTKINGTYPSSVLPDNFVVRSFDGKNITSWGDFSTAMQRVNPGDKIILGNGTDSFTLTAAASPDNPEQGFIGVKPLRNEIRLKEGVSLFWYNVYSWLRGLFRWTGLLSFLIGIVNLLPLGPVDGGRMIKTLMERVSKNPEQATKRWAFISVLILALLLLSIVIPLIR